MCILTSIFVPAHGDHCWSWLAHGCSHDGLHSPRQLSMTCRFDLPQVYPLLLLSCVLACNINPVPSALRHDILSRAGWPRRTHLRCTHLSGHQRRSVCALSKHAVSLRRLLCVCAISLKPNSTSWPRPISRYHSSTIRKTSRVRC